MADAKELIEALRDDFFRRCENDRKLKQITERLEKGTYVDAHDYSVRIGELLSQSFSEILTEGIYPELTEEMAREIIPSLLGSGYKRTSEACVQVQRNLNQQAGLGLKPIGPEFDVSRAYDLAEKYVSYDKWEDARWSLGEPVENFMQSVPDDSIRRNADFQWRSGMSPKIIRRAEPGACKWCRGLAGTYDYADVRETGNDVYRRHERCRCVVEYDPGDGKRQDVHSKRWKDAERKQERILYSEEPIEMFRRRISESGKEIIDKPTYNKLTKTFLRNGGEIIRGEEAARRLDKAGASASYFWGANRAYIRDDATVSDVLEEMYHARQDRTKMFSEFPNDEVLLRREIDAQYYLISVENRYKIPLEEREQTRENLEDYERQLQELLEWKNNHVQST